MDSSVVVPFEEEEGRTVVCVWDCVRPGGGGAGGAVAFVFLVVLLVMVVLSARAVAVLAPRLSGAGTVVFAAVVLTADGFTGLAGRG